MLMQHMELINRTRKVCIESIIQSIQYQNCRMVINRL
jgi:hypothetical protein